MVILTSHYGIRLDESRSFVEENQRDVGCERVFNLPVYIVSYMSLIQGCMRFRNMLAVIAHKFCREKMNPSSCLRPSFPC